MEGMRAEGMTFSKISSRAPASQGGVAQQVQQEHHRGEGCQDDKSTALDHTGTSRRFRLSTMSTTRAK